MLTREMLQAGGWTEISPGKWIKPNPGLSSHRTIELHRTVPEPPKAKRIRQSSKPLLNKLETEFFNRIKDKYPNFPPVRPQAKTYRLCNGVRYSPDFTASSWPYDDNMAKETAWEVKGKKAFDGSLEKLKMAAHEYPEIRWLLVWKDKNTGEWQEQVVLP